MKELKENKCIPCQGGVPPLPVKEKEELLQRLNTDWELTHNKTRLRRSFSFPDFKQPYLFVEKISILAEKEWHHPEICFGWGHLEIVVYTHKINDLVFSDFVLAAKIDDLAITSPE